MALDRTYPQTPNLVGPTTQQVDSQSTVQGQIGSIMASGNPLLERAKTRAAKAANKRGLVNSSMGVQAGEEAVLSAAMPIAQQDANTFNNQSLTNQATQNQFDRDSNTYERQSSLKDQDFNQKTGGGGYGPGLIGAELASKKELLSTEQDYQASSAKTSQEYQQANMTLQNNLSRQLQELGQADNIELTELKNALDLGTIDSQVYANTQGSYLTAVNELMRQSAISVNEIQTANDISGEDKAKMMADQAKLLTLHLNKTKSLYQGTATWSQGWAAL